MITITVLPPLLGNAELMSGTPCTEHGESMPTASWYRVTTAAATCRYVAVTSHGVYTCTPTGRVRDFFACLYQRAAVDTHADALRHIGFEIAGGVR